MWYRFPDIHPFTHGFLNKNYESNLTVIHSGYMICSSQTHKFNNHDNIKSKVQFIKFPVTESFLFPILILLGCFPRLSLYFFSQSDNISNLYKIADKMTVLNILIFRYLEVEKRSVWIEEQHEIHIFNFLLGYDFDDGVTCSAHVRRQ